MNISKKIAATGVIAAITFFSVSSAFAHSGHNHKAKAHTQKHAHHKIVVAKKKQARLVRRIIRASLK